LDGGAPTTLASISAGDVVVDGAHLDWATYLYDTGELAPPEAHPGSVMTMPSSGGAWTILANGAYAASIASDADAIYWTTFPGGSVMKVARDGGAPTMLFGGGAGFDASIDGGAALGSIAVDATAVYWTDLTNDRVMKVGHDGVGATQLATGQGDPYDIAVDGDNVYWTNRGDGRVVKVSRDGGAPVTLASGRHEPVEIAIDEMNVYWIELTNVDGNSRAGSAIMSVPIGGGEPTSLWEGDAAADIAVDARSIYWISRLAIMKLGK
jgi:hypothetical protein